MSKVRPFARGLVLAVIALLLVGGTGRGAGAAGAACSTRAWRSRTSRPRSTRSRARASPSTRPTTRRVLRRPRRVPRGRLPHRRRRRPDRGAGGGVPRRTWRRAAASSASTTPRALEPDSDWFTGLVGSAARARARRTCSGRSSRSATGVHPATKDLPLEWTAPRRVVQLGPEPGRRRAHRGHRARAQLRPRPVRQRLGPPDLVVPRLRRRPLLLHGHGRHGGELRGGRLPRPSAAARCGGRPACCAPTARRPSPTTTRRSA